MGSRRGGVLLAAIAWLVYLPWEYGMKLRILCSGECNIRIDLLLLYPLLVVVSVIGLVSFARARVRRARAYDDNDRSLSQPAPVNGGARTSRKKRRR